MATQSCCQLCEKHDRQWEIAQNSLDVLRSEVVERRVRENEALERERFAKDQVHSLVRHAQELQRILDELKRENPTLWASLPIPAINADLPKTTQETAENFLPTPAQVNSFRPMLHDVPGKADITVETSNIPPKTTQETAENFPPTPAQANSFRPMPHDVPGKADITVEIPTIQEDNEAMAPSSSNLGTSDNRVVSEGRYSLKGLTAVLFPESRVETSVLPVIPEVEPSAEVSLNPGDVEAQSVDSEKTVSEDLEPRTQDQGNKHEKEKEKERQSYETQFAPMEVMDYPLDHTMSSSDERPANNGSHRKRKRRTLVQASSDEDDDEEYEVSPPSKKKLFNTFSDPAAVNAIPLQIKIQHRSSPRSPGSRLALIGMEFGGGITVSEIFTKDPEMVGSKRIPRKLKGKAIAELPGPAQPELKQASPPSSNEAEDDETDPKSSDRDPTYSAEASESPEADTDSDESSEDPDYIDLSDSELSSPFTRSSAKAARSESERSESSQRPLSRSGISSGGSDHEVIPKAVNLLRDSSGEDSDDDHDDMDGFIVHENTIPSSEENVSDREEPDSDSDSSDNITLRALREEIVQKQKNRVWDFEGDMLVAIQSHAEIALQAVCVLYRQQTEDEQGLKSSLYRNGRGFDKMTALRGSTFAQFLVGGDGSGKMKESVSAFQARFPGGLRCCQDIAAHHSKQLFEIYCNNEDPFWGKSRGRAT